MACGLTAPQVARRCVFCGGSPVTREHVLGQWIPKAVGLTNAVFIVNVPSTLPDGSTILKRRPSRTVDVICKRVCKSCNVGWMSSIEGSASRLLGPMIQGRPVTLSAEDQMLIARWTMKTAIMVEHLHSIPSPNAPQILRWLIEGGTAPSRLWILLAARSQSGSFIECDHRALRLRSHGPFVHNVEGALVTFAIGHVVLQAFKAPPGSGEEIRIPGPSRGFISQICPVGDVVCAWPPPNILSQEHLTTMRQNFITPPDL